MMATCKSRVPVSVRRVLVPKETVKSGDMGLLYRYGGCWYRISSACDATVAILYRCCLELFCRGQRECAVGAALDPAPGVSPGRDGKR
jgi:hypothetical protein